VNGKYILDENGEPKREDDTVKWAKAFEKNPSGRIVKQTKVGDAKVSTVFVGTDHAFMPGVQPLLWETMIFGGKHDQFQRRYVTRAAAAKRHDEIVKLLEKGENPE